MSAKASLLEKQKMIEKLCETESRHLDMIESMEMKLRYSDFDLEGHYYQKYSEL